MKHNNSYRFDSFNNCGDEASRLDLRAKVDLRAFLPRLRECGLTRNMRVLDVGAGTGRRALEMARFITRGSVLGIDTSTELLRRASVLGKASGQSNLEFRFADVTSLAEVRALGRFDFIHVRLVIQHLSDPVKVLRTLRAALNPEGCIFLEDTDRDWMAVCPSTKAWQRLYAKMKTGQSKLGGDPNSGHKLAHYLSKAGFKDVSIKLVPVWGNNAKVMDWLIHYAPSYLNFLSPRDVPGAKRVLKELEIRCRANPMYFYQTWFQVTAKRS